MLLLLISSFIMGVKLKFLALYTQPATRCLCCKKDLLNISQEGQIWNLKVLLEVA